MDTYPVCWGGRQIGSMTLEREGGWFCARLRCHPQEQGICRAFLLCRRGEVPLGVLEPAGEELSLCRRVHPREIESRGGVTGAAVRLSYSFRESWQRADGGFFRREDYGEVGWEGAVWRQAGGLRVLALPYEPGRPFPLTRLFCFARIMAVQGRCCAVFSFDGEERPVMVEKTP